MDKLSFKISQLNLKTKNLPSMYNDNQVANNLFKCRLQELQNLEADSSLNKYQK